MSIKLPNLSIIVPARNEENNIASLISRVHSALAEKSITYELIFIDDHSTDDTYKKIFRYTDTHPVRVYKKQGRLGKAESIIEGATYAQYDYVCMLDSDLQYPPEIIPEMLAIAVEKGVALANRKTYNTTPLRRIFSRMNAWVFGYLLHGIKADVQSGLKIFPKEVFEHLNPKLVNGWAIDIPLLVTAKDLGYHIGSVDIDFTLRKNGSSKVAIASAVRQIAVGALKTKLHRNRVYSIKTQDKTNMRGSGVAHKGNRFITHTTLLHHSSAFFTVTSWQKIVIGIIALLFIIGFRISPINTAIIFVGILSSIYFIDVLFNLFLILKSLYNPPEISVDKEELNSLDDRNLPVYTIMCPLYKEAHVLPQFIQSMNALDWPKEKLDVMLLLEEDDKTTIDAAISLHLPRHIRIVVVPHGHPKTKPKACNYGLSHAKGEYCVIYDAEDKPDSEQLKKAYIGFQHASENTVCLQAKLNYYNPNDNLLTRFFTAEYSLWFDVVLTGLQTINTSIPLGGTSNHFRTKDLFTLQGWDPFNVTEDCDLGIRLFQAGYKTAIIDSTTLEEANGNVKNWLRQRSRWIKGYMQTYLVHMRHPFAFLKKNGIHAFIFQLVVGGKISFMLINPFLWLATISYFALYAYVGPTIELLYPNIIFYMAVISLIFGNFLCLYYYMIGCAKREHWTLIKYIFLVPFYWLMVSVAAGIALVQLVVKPHYWEKTNHGLKSPKQKIVDSTVSKDSSVIKKKKLRIPFLTSIFTKSGILVFASGLGSFLNFLYNAYLGRTVSIETFGIINLFGVFFYIINIPVGALGSTITHRSGYLLGKYGTPVLSYWKSLFRPLFFWSFAATIVWLLATPFISNFFHIPSVYPLFLFSPIWVMGVGIALNNGFLGGSLQFISLAFLTILDASIKLGITVFLVQNNLTAYIYGVIPFSFTFTFLVGFLLIKKNAPSDSNQIDHRVVEYFPKKYFLASILSILSTMTFLTIDVLMVNHFFSPKEAGQYGLVSLVGKIIFIICSMFGQFTNPMVSRELGAGRPTQKIFLKLLAITVGVGVIGYVFVGMFGYFTVPILLGDRAKSIVTYLPLYAFAMLCYSISANIVSYHQVRKEYAFSLLSFFISVVQIIGMIFFHRSLVDVVDVMVLSGLAHITLILLLHIFYEPVRVIFVNTQDFLGLFGTVPSQKRNVPNSFKILMFNWRDMRHTWAGGAEVYIHELAKQMVAKGHTVTVFCGNDGKCPRNQVIDGVQIVRRGGFFTVYIWAFLYYILKFRGLFDIVIDSENGVPFFTPLYVRAPIFLLIHHVHQAVFRERLHFPLSNIASFAELKCMPFLYRNEKVITVSDSSKEDIISHNLASADRIHVIYPGINSSAFLKLKKTKYPTFLYLGRLKAYKNIEVALKAFSIIHKKYTTTMFIVAGDGELKNKLKKLANQFFISDSVSFLGRVTEQEKARLFAISWVAIQPSSYEGWGISVIEANASATPVIAANVHGLQDSVVDGKTGILVPVRNVTALAEAMEKIVVDTHLREVLSKQALKWSQTFTWQNAGEELESMIIDVYRSQPIYTESINLLFPQTQKIYEK